jgi:hypothetical protein
MSGTDDRFFGHISRHSPSQRLNMRSLIVLNCIALLAPSSLLAQADTTPPEQIAINFAWPAGLKASVVARRFQVRNTGGNPDTTEVTVGYTMTVEEHPDGLLVRYDDFRVLGIKTEDRGAVPSAQAIAEGFGAFLPDLVVSRSGELLRLEGTERLKSEIESLVAPLLGSATPQIDQLFETLLSEEFLTSKAAEEWNILVGSWIDSELEIGAVYELEAEEYSPLSPDIPIPFLYFFSLSSRRPCREGAPEPSCVVLEMRSYPEAEAVRRLIGELVETMTGQNLRGRFVYEEFEIENFVELIAEPGTLIPHTLEVKQEISGAGRVVGGPRSEFSQKRIRTVRFAYAGR